jgi:hypothetical protein
MSKDWYRLWREAYEDLHVAYLAVLRVRHWRKKDPQAEVDADMRRLDPFGDIGRECAAGAVEKWHGVWQAHASDEEKRQVMGAATEAIRNHWESWAAFMEVCPPSLRLRKPALALETFMTATAGVRDSMQIRANVLAEAWSDHLRRSGEAPSR